jgi:hypothetical protein
MTNALNMNYSFADDVPKDIRIWVIINKPVLGFRWAHGHTIRILYTGKVELVEDATTPEEKALSNLARVPKRRISDYSRQGRYARSS